MTRASARLTGTGASPGAAVGTAFLVGRRQLHEPRDHVAPEACDAEVARLHAAVEKSDRQLADIADAAQGKPQEHALIIEAYRLMVRDPVLLAEAERLVRAESINAEWAVRKVAKTLRAAFDGVDDPYFRERQNDVDFVADRVVHNLMGEWHDLAEPPPGAVVVAHELSPADAMTLLNAGRIAGIVTEAGGRTSHTAIVARALGVPAVVGCEGVAELVGHHDVVALDGVTGAVAINPDEAGLEAFDQARRRHEAHEREALALRELEARTTDGHAVVLRANIEMIEEVAGSVAHGADGVGLYRTEFLFLNRRDLPSEEEHYRTYRKLLEALPGREVTIRTFDLGGEKHLPGGAREEENPGLGLRAIRYCLAHPGLFMDQLRGLWRASAHGRLRVMFPLVSSTGELRRAKALFADARAQVVAQGHPVAADVPVGIMVETPAAVEVADLLAREAAFFSVGTNDLVQYALAVDRANHDVAAEYRPLHPAILRMLRRVFEAGRAAGVGVSVCGEMAGDPACTLLLLALGARELSMGGGSIPAVKQVVRSSSLAEARFFLEQALAVDGTDGVEAWVRDEMRRRYPDVFAEEYFENGPYDEPHSEHDLG